MKIVEYTLNADGTIPDSIVDGGYFAVSNGLPSPQDWTFMGVADDDALFSSFATEQDFLDKLSAISVGWVYHSHSEDKPEPFDPVRASSFLWSKLST